MDGIDIWLLTALTCSLNDMHDRPHATLHNALTAFTFLFGKLDQDNDNLSSEQHYHAVSNSVFSLCLEALANKHTALILWTFQMTLPDVSWIWTC
jgi:hypothetical protein